MKNNYATREACQRLKDAGIEIETDVLWSNEPEDSDDEPCHTVWKWKLRTQDEGTCEECLPAPTLAEVWRELPDDTWLRKIGKSTKIMNSDNLFFDYDENPSDAAIDLLIWLKEKGLYK